MKGHLVLLLLSAALASTENIKQWSHISRDGPTVLDTPTGIQEEEGKSEENHEDITGSVCEESSLSSHENCNQFYICAHGLPVALSCPVGLLYDPKSESCEWPSSVQCNDRIIPEVPEKPEIIEEEQNTAEPHTVESEEDSINIESVSECQYNGQFILNENCNQFSLCAHGLPVTMNCPDNLLFNPEINTCDWPRNVDCGERIIPDANDDETEEADGEEIIASTEPTIIPTTEGDIVSTAAPISQEEIKEDSSEIGDSVDVVDTPSTEAPAESDEEWAEDQSADDDICDLSRGFDGHAYPHEYCHQFYLCAHGTATPMVCPWILLFNTETRRCDWPRNVNCGERTIPVEFASI